MINAFTGNAGGRGDPIMTGFGGRSFEFIGQPDTTYSLVSEKFHKVPLLPRSSSNPSAMFGQDQTRKDPDTEGGLALYTACRKQMPSPPKHS